MGGFRCLTDKSYEIIKKLCRNKSISERTYRELEDCDSLEQIEEVFRKNMNINRKLVWMYLVDSWQWKKCDKMNNTTFNEFQSQFMKELINHNYCYRREECENRLTEQQISNQIIPLVELNYILALKGGGNSSKTFFVLHPQIVKEIKQEGGIL